MNNLFRSSTNDNIDWLVNMMLTGALSNNNNNVEASLLSIGDAHCDKLVLGFTRSSIYE